MSKYLENLESRERDEESILFTETHEVYVADKRFFLQFTALNPFTPYQMDTTGKLSEVTEAALQTIRAQQKAGVNYFAAQVMQYEEPNSTDVVVGVYGAQVPQHELLWGAMFRAGLSLDEIRKTGQSGLTIPLPTSHSPYSHWQVVYKLHPEERKGDYKYLVWVYNKPWIETPEFMIDTLHFKMERTTKALHAVFPQVVARATKTTVPENPQMHFSFP